jgi:probable F420-dependent oxidoreductase
LKFGLYGLHKGDNVEPEALARRARAAEDAGFESIWVGDHVALPADAPDAPREPRLEAVVALGHLAAVTTRVRLAFGIIVLPQRQPVLLAKQIASVDVLSGGRLTIGFGVGYVEAEFRALGFELAGRGARADEYLEAMLALWDEPVPAFAGQHVALDGVLMRPLPVQRPHPPIVIGGHSQAALKRAARAGGGWFGWERTPEQVAETVTALHDLGGDGLEITVKPDTEPDLEAARRFARAGADRLILEPRTSRGADADALIAKARDELIDRV